MGWRSKETARAEVENEVMYRLRPSSGLGADAVLPAPTLTRCSIGKIDSGTGCQVTPLSVFMIPAALFGMPTQSLSAVAPIVSGAVWLGLAFLLLRSRR